MNKIFNKVAIIGMGLIGGSLGLSIKRGRIAKKVIGISRKKSTLAYARKIGAIDEWSRNFKPLKACDLVILSAPVETIINLICRIAPFLAKGCIVIDVGSTKFEIIKAAEKSLDKKAVDFIGAHPLAGSEERGIKNAVNGLFKGSLCILTPTKRNKAINIAKIKRLWRKLGARVTILNPAEHDKIVAFTSHLPHLAAFSLTASVPDKCLKYASGGLKDTTRIASSDEALWSDIFFTNKKNAIKSISIMQDQLHEFKNMLKRDKRIELTAKLKKTKLKRKKLL